MIGYLFYFALLMSIVLAVWGIARKSARIMFLTSLICLLCSLAALWSIGLYLLLLTGIFLIIGFVFSMRRKGDVS